MTVVRRKEGYQTPQARDCHSGTARPHGFAKSGAGTQHNLNDFVLRWPTPCATDYKGPGKTPRDRLDYAVNGATKSAVYPTPRIINSLCGVTGVWNCIQSNPNLTDEEKRGLTSTHGQLNPDWVEWLMFWAIGWTDLETPNHRLYWLDPSIDPADFVDNRIPRITNRRDNRSVKIKELGNGQFPLSAVIALDWGIIVLDTILKG